LVVGGGSGIGFAIARACLDKGARVVIAGRTLEKLTSALALLDAGERARAVRADITREDEVVHLLDACPALGHIVVTAAELAYQSITAFELESARRACESKILGPLLIAKHGAPRLRAGGSLTFTSGIAAERPMPRGSMVAAVNGALNAFIRGAALELAPVRVNALSPGWVDTELWNGFGERKAGMLAAMAERLPTGRVGTPDDLAHAAVFLMESAFSTGNVLHVDGGHRLV
jgi:NAD(P)-dependent dehydrogenase (short-subunit alcohol dehydrogenase family)